MAKASVKLPNGTVITLEGTVEEIQRLLVIYGTQGAQMEPGRAEEAGLPPPRLIEPDPAAETEAASAEEPTHSGVDLNELVQLIHTCGEARAIERRILDDPNEMHRVLLPLYILHEYHGNAFGLTSTEISKMYAHLGIRLSRQNVMRALRMAGSKYVTKEGEDTLAPRYTLNRKGFQYLRVVINREEQ
jgi:hypothetical protein